ncbi:MAG TPA: hypothetical protein ENH56_08530 [Roseobacter sp.]|uniref:Uncharacterized protein n=1 Tax=marine sediment metagenome TaxID=412755 RepID=A0A0F9RBD1_9ZZZZ|nr:hypothetical protein [Roseobacter sp.]
MMSIALKFGWRLLTSRVGLAVILCAGLWTWHVIDKSQAINSARDGYVLQVELAAAQAELAELRRRAAVADDANRVLQEKVQASEGEALRFAAELEAFENETDINPEGVVDGDLLRRLRSN